MLKLDVLRAALKVSIMKFCRKGSSRKKIAGGGK